MSKLNKASQFYDAIDEMISGGSTVLEAIVEYCHKRNLEVEAVVPLVTRNSNLVSKLRDEAEAMNSIEKVSHLPL
jgi:hypothetical protein